MYFSVQHCNKSKAKRHVFYLNNVDVKSFVEKKKNDSKCLINVDRYIPSSRHHRGLGLGR